MNGKDILLDVSFDSNKRGQLDLRQGQELI